jgi:hypothetical protein
VAGWAFFWAFGYAGYLFPLLLAGYGASAFIRSRMVTDGPRWRAWACS